MANSPRDRCACKAQVHPCSLVVLTGGPGAGKTAVLELVRKNFCPHVAVLPEAAGIVFGGGFWRKDSIPARKASQRAIYHVQREMERLAQEEREAAVALCDRGTLDGLAYWPESESSFWKELATSREQEIERYSAVIHLRTPSLTMGYNHSNPIRLETAEEAARVDGRIAGAWAGHPKRFFVESTDDFITKAIRAVDLIRNEVPDCCKGHRIASVEPKDSIETKGR